MLYAVRTTTWFNVAVLKVLPEIKTSNVLEVRIFYFNDFINDTSYLKIISYNLFISTVPRLCGAAGECEDDYMCQDSMCVPKCKTDEECALNERCSKGTCLCKYKTSVSQLPCI